MKSFVKNLSLGNSDWVVRKVCHLPERETLSLFSKAVHYTYTIEKITWNKGHQCLCSQDMQRSETHRGIVSRQCPPSFLHALGFWWIFPMSVIFPQLHWSVCPRVARTKSIPSVSQHIIKRPIKISPSNRMSPTYNTRINHFPQASGPYWPHQSHKSSGSTLETQADFSLSFFPDLSTWTKVLI